jgi:hypothetical protein
MVDFLIGPLPTELGHLTVLENLACHENQALSEALPVELGLLTAVEDLKVGINNFTGPHPFLSSHRHLACKTYV